MNNPMILASVKEDFYLNFIKDDRYLWLLDGLKTTLIITVFAVIVGLIIGFLVAIIRSAHDKSGKRSERKNSLRKSLPPIRSMPSLRNGTSINLYHGLKVTPEAYWRRWIKIFSRIWANEALLISSRWKCWKFCVA